MYKIKILLKNIFYKFDFWHSYTPPWLLVIIIIVKRFLSTGQYAVLYTSPKLLEYLVAQKSFRMLLDVNNDNSLNIAWNALMSYSLQEWDLFSSLQNIITQMEMTIETHENNNQKLQEQKSWVWKR